MKMRSLLVALSLFVALPACGGRTKSAADWQQKTPYARGTVLHHIPDACPHGSVVIDLQRAVQNEATALLVDRFGARLAGAMGTAEGLDKLKVAMRDEGFDPLRDTREIAFCDRGDVQYFIFGGDFSGKDIFRAVQKATGDDAPTVREVDGVQAITLGHEHPMDYLRVAPNVIVVSKDGAGAAKLRADRDRSAAFEWTNDRIAVASFGGSEQLHVLVSERGGELEVTAEVRIKATQAELETRKGNAAKKLVDTPLKMLSAPVSAMTVESAGGRARLTLRASTSTAADAIRTLLEMPKEQTDELLRFVLSPDGGEQKI